MTAMANLNIFQKNFFYIYYGVQDSCGGYDDGVCGSAGGIGRVLAGGGVLSTHDLLGG